MSYYLYKDIFDLNIFFESGGHIEVLLNKRIRSDFPQIVDKIVFYNKDETINYNVFNKKMIYCGKQVDLQLFLNKILIVKNKFKSNFPNMDMPDLIIKKDLLGSYFPDKERPLISIPTNNLIDYSGFTLGHELGHHYIINSQINFNGASNNKFFLFIIIIIIHLFTLINILFINTEHSILEKYSLGLVFGVCIFTYVASLFTWKKRSIKYQVEYFCDDFSFWINDDIVEMFGYKHQPFISGTRHPHNRSREKRKRKICNFEDIKIKNSINEFFNLLCLGIE